MYTLFMCFVAWIVADIFFEKKGQPMRIVILLLVLVVILYAFTDEHDDWRY